ncbi:MAG: ribosome maturation factor RimM [Microthrixaceae bacterium]
MVRRPQDPPEGLLEVGRITKAHGLRGEVIVEFTSDRPERREPGVSFTTPDGDIVLADTRPHGDRWLTRFEGAHRREDAEALRGTVLWAEPLDDTEGVLWVHELVGAKVIEHDGTERGTVASVVSNPASDLLELDNGALIPTVFVVEGPSDGTVTVATPEGLFDL